LFLLSCSSTKKFTTFEQYDISLYLGNDRRQGYTLKSIDYNEHLYSPRMAAEIKEGKIGTANEQTVM